MNARTLYCAGSTPAARYAEFSLRQLGIPIDEQPTQDTGYLLLDVPSFSGNHTFRGACSLDDLLNKVSADTIIFGGNINQPELIPFQKIDLLKDEEYLCQNAAITADCALQLAMPMLTTTLAHSPTLVIGWGRIGKCLAQLLRSAGVQVTVAVRKPEQAAILKALDFSTLFIHDIAEHTEDFRLMINTVPYPILSETDLSKFRNCAMMDLASRRGLESENILWARSLPGIHAPESSGRLIAETVMRYIKEDQ